MHNLKPVGRLDRDSSGLLILTNDGRLAQTLQHPSQGKWKRYDVELSRPLTAPDAKRLQDGVTLKDGLSRLSLSGRGAKVTVRLQEGRNRQIRRSFGTLGYAVRRLHRSEVGGLRLGRLASGRWRELTAGDLQQLTGGASL